MRRAEAAGAARLAAVLGLAAAGLVVWRLARGLPPAIWMAGAIDPAPGDVRQLVFHYATLPRLVVALACGAALGLAGALFQQTLRNPLASPTTLGVEAGAQLALAVALLFAPGLLALPLGREVAALAGAGAATGLVFAVAFARGFSSLSLILAGLVVGLFCGALGAVLKLLNQEYVSVLYIWGAGALDQQDWSVAARLVPRVAVLAAGAALLARPLALMALDDSGARGLGLALRSVRLAALSVAVLLTVAVTAAVGVVGFVGLAAPQIARFAGARTLHTRLVLAPLVGAFLLTVVDQGAWALSRDALPVPTGAATALLGAPLLLWLLPRLRRAEPPVIEAAHLHARRADLGPLALRLALALGLVAALALLVSRGPDGWTLAGPGAWPIVAEWRLPRVAVALGAGAMLGVAGALLQRLTGNAMASPEVLGIGAGVALGLVATLFLDAAPGRPLQLAAGALGALAVLALLLSGGARARFAPDQILLTGIALGALLDAVVVGFLALGDPRAAQVLSWLAGSTYGVTGGSALATLLLGAALLLAAAPLLRWLDLLPLGPTAVRSLGVPLGPARLAVMLLAAALTTAAMLVAGPLTFVGLTGPHLARALGLVRAGPQVVGAALIGALVMVAADWVGRVAIAPQELPAGLVAALIGAPYLLRHLTRCEG